MEDLVLDPKIRDWVVIPVTFMLTFIMLVRHYVTKYMRSTPTSTVEQVADTHLIRRGKLLEANGHWLPRESFERRRVYFVDSEVGKYCEERPEVDAMDALSKNPAMQGMMGSQMAMIVPQLVASAVVNYFFSGFVILRLPFPLTSPFKAMLQQGIMLSDLNVSYVSSLSWYFLNLFGLRGVLDIILAGGNAADDSKLMQQQMGQGPAGVPQDMNKVFPSEKLNLELVAHDWKAKDVFDRIVTGKSRVAIEDGAVPSTNASGASGASRTSASASSTTKRRRFARRK